MEKLKVVIDLLAAHSVWLRCLFSSFVRTPPLMSEPNVIAGHHSRLSANEYSLRSFSFLDSFYPLGKDQALLSALLVCSLCHPLVVFFFLQYSVQISHHTILWRLWLMSKVSVYSNVRHSLISADITLVAGGFLWWMPCMLPEREFRFLTYPQVLVRGLGNNQLIPYMHLFNRCNAPSIKQDCFCIFHHQTQAMIL